MENPPPPPPPPPPLPVKEVRFNTAEEELAKAKEKVEELERAMREQAEAAKQQAEEKKESTTTTTTTTTDVFQMEEDLSGSEDLSISSCDTSLGVERRRRKSTVTGVEYSDSNDDSDSSAPAARPAPTVRAKSKSKGRSKSRSTTSSKAADLDTLVPETEFLDIHRLDIDKVVSLHRYYDGCSVPHYLSHAFDEGYLTDVKTHIPDDHKETLVPVGVIEAVFTNHSRKKDSADILKYCIYVLKKTGETIYDAATSLFYEDGTAIGRISCLFGSVGEPSYLVQDRLAEVEEEEENDYTEATPHASVGDVLYTSALYATTLYEEPERPDQKKESATDVLTRKYHTPGCDASFLEDEELPVEKQEFSDDEKEQAAKAEKKRKRAEPRDMSKTSIGLLDCLSDSGTSSVNSEFEFNSDGEIIQVIRKSEACPKTKKLRKTRGARSAVPAPSGKAAPGAVPFFVPQPPPLIKGDPKKSFRGRRAIVVGVASVGRYYGCFIWNCGRGGY
eukprot:TRINITY_DN2884_c5_g1_i3.p1 TRINITY_DN2884_c5_g1~~TRINITY_DN2884_c5_g1_i3.p1  ORF type:complete len:524 (+),score=114.06 TRINITY_DN2884_c5_g1_i3:64-1572(+)